MTNTTDFSQPHLSVFDVLWEAPMSNRGHVTFDAKHTAVDLRGLSTGKVTALSIRPNEALGGYVVVLHVEGSAYWSRRGETSYAGAEIQTILVETEPRSFGGGQGTYRYVTLSTAVEVKGNAATRAQSTATVIERLSRALNVNTQEVTS